MAFASAPSSAVTLDAADAFVAAQDDVAHHVDAVEGTGHADRIAALAFGHVAAGDR